MAVVGQAGALFAKNSDRPVTEAQVIEAHARRGSGGELATTYMRLPDAGAHALIGSRPAWMWGFEHGVNEHGVAIGNEEVWTVDDPHAEPPALLGMDLVRLGLERGANADQALDAMVGLLEEHGQGGVANQVEDEPYFSSFIMVDARGGWVLETSARTWAARPIQRADAISNRLSIRTEWSRASDDVAPGSDFDRWRHPDMWTGLADRRLDATRACVLDRPESADPRSLAAVLRHHGEEPWGAPGGGGPVAPLPQQHFDPDTGDGFSVCMHLRGYQATTSSMIAELPHHGGPVRAWVAPGSPCASIYVPTFAPGPLPPQLAQPSTVARFTSLARSVERDDSQLTAVRQVFDPLEAALWDEADEAAGDPARREQLVVTLWPRVEDALDRIEAVLGPATTD